MNRSFNYGALAGQCVKWAGNIAALALLLSLVYFGHHYQWQLPKFSELTHRDGDAGDASVRPPSMLARAAAGQPEKVASGLDESGNCFPAEPERVQSVHAFKPEEREFDLPAIYFGSRRQVERAGIKFGSVELRSMDEFVAANGTVDYDHTRLARLSTRVSGIAWRVDKCVGEPVAKGELLALVDCPEVGQAKSEFLDALVQSRLKEQTFKRLSNLPHVIPLRRILEAEADWQASSIRCINAEQSLITMGLPVDFHGDSHAFDAQLVSRVHHLGLSESLLESIGAETQSANLLPMVSPLDGMVIRRDVVTGEVVPSSQTLFVVADVSRMWLHLNVRAEEVNCIAMGQEVLISHNEVMRDCGGKVTWISTEVDPATRTVKLRADVPNPSINRDAADTLGHRLLHANAYISAQIRVRRNPETLAVPSSAVRWFWQDSCHVVFLPIEGGIALQPHRVQPGVTRNGYTEIVSGLSPSDSVAVTGTRLLQLELAALGEPTKLDESPKSTVAKITHP